MTETQLPVCPDCKLIMTVPAGYCQLPQSSWVYVCPDCGKNADAGNQLPLSAFSEAYRRELEKRTHVFHWGLDDWEQNGDKT